MKSGSTAESAPKSSPETAQRGQDEEGPMAYIGNLPEKVVFVDLSAALARYGGRSPFNVKGRVLFLSAPGYPAAQKSEGSEANAEGRRRAHSCPHDGHEIHPPLQFALRSCASYQPSNMTQLSRQHLNIPRPAMLKFLFLTTIERAREGSVTSSNGNNDRATRYRTPSTIPMGSYISSYIAPVIL
jgi:hypothetical protein